ncbi:superoxide dismutase family protein [Mycobacterium sp.]|uniref:superoxide dismutase family protein n=1 Tax=Mycobacterium sp. TaxID=1785 RepID=UPI003BAE58B1
MNRGRACAVAASAAAIAVLAGCVNQGGGGSTSSSPPPGTERMTTQVKGADGTTIANATIDFANGFATVTVEAGPNQVLSPGFHGLQIHSVGKCEANSTAPSGDSTGSFASAGSVYQAPDHTGYPASGDLTALQVRPDGSAKLVTTTSLFTAADLRNNLGSALIIHQNADNLSSSPAGNSAKRVACGVIAAGSATTTSSTTTTSVSTVTTTVEVPPPSTSTSTSTITVTSSPTTTSTTTTNNISPGR